MIIIPYSGGSFKEFFVFMNIPFHDIPGIQDVQDVIEYAKKVLETHKKAPAIWNLSAPEVPYPRYITVGTVPYSRVFLSAVTEIYAGSSDCIPSAGYDRARRRSVPERSVVPAEHEDCCFPVRRRSVHIRFPVWCRKRLNRPY